jgi:hypothetical protein
MAADSLRKAHFVVSVLSCLSGQQGVAAMPMQPPDGRKVKSAPVGTIAAADRHERPSPSKHAVKSSFKRSHRRTLGYHGRQRKTSMQEFNTIEAALEGLVRLAACY